jgi:hypothetical protein
VEFGVVVVDLVVLEPVPVLAVPTVGVNTVVVSVLVVLLCLLAASSAMIWIAPTMKSCQMTAG